MQSPKKKICYVATLPTTLESFVIGSALYNMKKGDWDVTVICNSDPVFSASLPSSIRYIPIKIRRGISLSGILTTFRLYRIFRKEQYDLVQYTTANAGAYAAIASWLTRIPIRLYCQWGLSYVHMKGLAKLAKGTLERLICKLSTHIQPDSRENLQIAFKNHLYDDRKGCVIGSGSASGVDFTKFDISHRNDWRNEIRDKYSISSDSFSFGYVGRMLHDKGVNELLGAFETFLSTHPDSYLFMVGNDTTPEGISQTKWDWARQSPNVIFTGQTSHVEKYLAAMDCFILPSYHEGFGSVTIEAEAMGLPVIDTDIPGSREAMKNGVTGIAIPIKDEQALLEAMNTIFSNSTLRTTFSQNALKYAFENFEQTALFEKIFLNRQMLLDTIPSSINI